jgi:hypothetical protein
MRGTIGKKNGGQPLILVGLACFPRGRERK